MKSLLLFLRLLALLAVTAIACPISAEAAPSMLALYGRISVLAKDHIVFNDDRTIKFVPAETLCFDAQNQKLTCETLIGVGYVDKARIVLRGGVVRAIHIIDLQQ